MVSEMIENANYESIRIVRHLLKSLHDTVGTNCENTIDGLSGVA